MLSYCHVVQPLVVKEARKAKTTLPTGLCRKRLTVLSVKKKIHVIQAKPHLRIVLHGERAFHLMLRIFNTITLHIYAEYFFTRC